MNDNQKTALQQVANAIRVLSMDAIDQANSGHPGLPLGCAEIAACLYGLEMRHNPRNPGWIGRDRFFLSAGHGSMLLYSALHLAGYDLPLEEIRNFRQLDSKTPGHPEHGHTPGVEMTTGPLGQGLASAAGTALANKMAAARFGLENEKLLDGQVFVLCGDGCMMEGVTNEAASLAAHLHLDNLVVIYDSNSICLDGPTAECFTENTAARYQALGWAVETIDGHDLEAIEKALAAARARTGQPSLIVAKTIIGKGSPAKQGKSEAHGAPLGAAESLLAKTALGLSPELFFVPESVRSYMQARLADLAAGEAAWNDRFNDWAAAHPEQAALWKTCVEQALPADLDASIRAIDTGTAPAGRKASNTVLQQLNTLVPFLVGGSADLSCSDLTMMKAGGVVNSRNYAARNIKFGVREFAMGAMTSGIALQGMFLPYCGTFLVFSDYLRNAIRLAALMNLRLVYQFTHDSIFVGEDGPTHQPVEHIPSLRTIPGLTVFRPADANEVKAAWSWILRRAQGPCVLALTRQNLPDLAGTAVPTDEGVGRGGYILRRESDPAAIDYCLLASGSEVALALEVADRLAADGRSVRVVSMPCMERFDAQDKAYRDSVLGTGVRQYWSVEAQVDVSWYKYIGREGHAVAMNGFGTSAPAKDCAKRFGFTADQILERMARNPL